ncbi:MAG TPA: DUF4198 domain-containing protein [Thermoanaerobaculia bacterium]
MRRAGWFAAALALVAAPLCAHDFWIEPTTFRPAVGDTLGVRLIVGQKFRGDTLPRNPAMISRFVLVSDAGETPVAGHAADEPAGAVRIEQPGLALIAYRSLDSAVSLEAAKFEDYLKEEGLEAIIAARAKRGDSQKPSRELFSRSAKALIAAGGSGASGFDRIVGLTLELVPESNPYAMKEGDTLPVRLLYEGKPLPGALVVALSYDDPDRKIAARSDRDGRVSLRLPKEGVWLVKAVHMVPVLGDPNEDWRSIWASLTFEVPGAVPTPKPE